MSENSQILPLNAAQLRGMMHYCPVEVDLWSRGGGKTTGIAIRDNMIMRDLPGSVGMHQGLTYTQLLQYTLPSYISSLERMGMKEDRDFFVRKKPPAKLKWEKPYFAPPSFDNFISIRVPGTSILQRTNGMVLSSQDAPANGVNVDWINVDEAALIDREKFIEVAGPANRGNRDKAHFRKHRLHHSIKFTSSKPMGTRGKWLLAMGKYYEEDGHNYELINDLIVDLMLEMIAEKNRDKQAQLWSLICKKKKEITWYPSKEGVFYNEATGFDNIKVLGMKFFTDLFREMSRIKFCVQVLNKTLKAVELGFYPNFDENKHCYYDTTENLSYIQGLEHNYRNPLARDCRWDMDCDPFRPVYLVGDFNVEITTILAYQIFGREIRIIKAFYVLHPKILQHAYAEVGDYYFYHKNKQIPYIYDRIGNYRRDNSILTNAEQAAAQLISRGFEVELLTKNTDVPDHDENYLLVNTVLEEADPSLPYIRINGNQCKPLITSLQLAGTLPGKGGIRKNKNPEKDKLFAQQDATHFSDCLDMIIKHHTTLREETQHLEARTY